MAPSKTTLVTDTTAYTGLKAFAVQCVADTVIATLTGLTNSPAGVTISSGTVIWGNFTALTLTSGKVLIYEI